MNQLLGNPSLRGALATRQSIFLNCNKICEDGSPRCARDDGLWDNVCDGAAYNHGGVCHK